MINYSKVEVNNEGWNEVCLPFGIVGERVNDEHEDGESAHCSLHVRIVVEHFRLVQIEHHLGEGGANANKMMEIDSFQK